MECNVSRKVVRYNLENFCSSFLNKLRLSFKGKKIVMNKYQSLLNDVNNGLLPLSKKSNWTNVVSLGEGCGKSQLLEDKVRTLFICPLTSEFNSNAIENFSTLLPEQPLHLHFKYPSLSGFFVFCWPCILVRV